MVIVNFQTNESAPFFRPTIKDSVENIYEELDSMSYGLFKTKRYHSSCEKAKIVLDEYENGVKELKKAI